MLPQDALSIAREEILATAISIPRKAKTMTSHRSGDSEVERDLRKMKTAPPVLTEKTMVGRVTKHLPPHEVALPGAPFVQTSAAGGDSPDTFLVVRRAGIMHIVCYFRQASNAFET